jgi:hypothetical protein
MDRRRTVSDHTPGPWEEKANTRKHVRDIRAKDGTWIAESYGSEDPECAANARLIAAAPELLQALKRYMFGHPCSDIHALLRHGECPAWREAEAAITRAEDVSADVSAQVCGHHGCRLIPGHIPGHTDR